MGADRVAWPDGKDFAFTVFDDTDNATVENVGPVYALLRDLGLRTTKSVWPVSGEGTPTIGGLTCDDPVYRAWTLGLQAEGFEIGYHGASNVTAPRPLVSQALERFRDTLRSLPLGDGEPLRVRGVDLLGARPGERHPPGCLQHHHPQLAAR